MNRKKIITGILLILFFMFYGKAIRFLRITVSNAIYAQVKQEDDDEDDYDDYDDESDDLSCCDGSDSGSDTDTTSSDDTSCSSESNEPNAIHDSGDYENCEFNDYKCEDGLIYKCNALGYWTIILDCPSPDFRCAVGPECGYDNYGRLIDYCCKRQ